ncbi:hypothetical protein IFVP203_C1180008 [Vibrio parahaemolyticus]
MTITVGQSVDIDKEIGSNILTPNKYNARLSGEQRYHNT